jgi:hypothetical protein
MAREFNGSGIPLEPHYDEVEGRRTISASRAAFPYGRGIAPTCIAGGCGRCANTPASQRPPNRTRAIAICSNAADRPLGRLRSADAARLRFRRAAIARRGRQSRRRDRLDRRHGDALRRHSARPRHRLDDDQRAGRNSARDAISPSRAGAGIPFSKLGGTIQNDVLKEYVARGTYIYPPGRRCAWSPT